MTYQRTVEELYALGHELASTPPHKFDLAYVRAMLEALEHPEPVEQRHLDVEGDDVGPQLAGELFRLTTGTNMVHVPYKGGAQAVIALLSGEVGIMFTVPFPTVPHVKSGKLRAVTLLGAKRIEAMPDVPTAIEAGYPALSNVNEWYGVVAPAATPHDVIAKLNAAIVRALNSPDVLARIHALGQYPAPSTPAEFAEFIRVDYERWGKVVKASGAKVD